MSFGFINLVGLAGELADSESRLTFIVEVATAAEIDLWRGFLSGIESPSLSLSSDELDNYCGPT